MQSCFQETLTTINQTWDHLPQFEKYLVYQTLFFILYTTFLLFVFRGKRMYKDNHTITVDMLNIIDENNLLKEEMNILENTDLKQKQKIKNLVDELKNYEEFFARDAENSFVEMDSKFDVNNMSINDLRTFVHYYGFCGNVDRLNGATLKRLLITKFPDTFMASSLTAD